MSTVTVTATVELANTPPRVRLDVTDIGSPNLFAATVTRLDPDGRIVPVRTTDGNPLTLSTSGANRTGILYDYEMPYGSVVTYSTAESPTATSAEVVVNESRVWLVHPGVPGLSMPVELRAGSLAEESYDVRMGVFYPMGRANPVVMTDGARQGMKSSIRVAIDTLIQVAAIRALVADAGVLLLNIPAPLGLGVPAQYIAVSTVTISRVTDMGGDPYRVAELPFIVVDRPAGGTTAERTLVDFLDFPTLADVASAYATLADAFAGP